MLNQVPGIPVEYWNITTGKSRKDTLNMGGLYQRKEASSRMLMYAQVKNIDKALAQIEQLGGKILSPKMTLNTIGTLVTIIDSEGNLIGLWELEKKKSSYPHSDWKEKRGGNSIYSCSEGTMLKICYLFLNVIVCRITGTRVSGPVLLLCQSQLALIHWLKSERLRNTWLCVIRYIPGRTFFPLPVRRWRYVLRNYLCSELIEAGSFMHGESEGNPEPNTFGRVLTRQFTVISKTERDFY